MKKFGIYLMTLALVAMTFVACNDDDEDPQAPKISINDGKDIELDASNLPSLMTIAIPVNVTSADENFTYIKTVLTLSEGDPVTLDYVNSFEDKRAWEKTYSVADSAFRVALMGVLGNFPAIVPVKLIVTVGINKLSRETEEFISFEVTNIPTPLDAPAAFEWKRDGTNITGMDNFGLTFDKNMERAWYAHIIKNGATKIVEFSATEWADIASKEALAEAVTDANDINDYVIPMVNNTTLDKYLAVEYNGEYLIMHLESFSTELGGQQQTVNTINGQYKK